MLRAEGTVQIAGPGQETANELATGPAAEVEPPADLRITGWLEPLKSTWNRTALLAVLIPALILIVIAVV